MKSKIIASIALASLAIPLSVFAASMNSTLNVHGAFVTEVEINRVVERKLDAKPSSV